MKTVTAILVFLAMLIVAGTASAQDNGKVIKQELCGYVLNPCCDELVDVCVDALIVLDKNGDIKHVTFSGGGTGENGTEYTFKAVMNSHQNSLEKGAGNYHEVLVEKLVATDGSDCSFKAHMVIHMTINPDGTVTAEFEKITAECDNGTVLE